MSAPRKLTAAELEQREPLVEDVLARLRALTQAALRGRGDCENEDAALFDALNKLEAWQP